MNSNRSFTLIDFSPPPSLAPDLDQRVRFFEYVRTNFRTIVSGVPKGCELALMASGHAHNFGQLPLIGLWSQPDAVAATPDLFVMIETVSAWCESLTTGEVQAIVRQTEAPSWDELNRIHVFPAPSAPESDRSSGQPPNA